MQPNKPEGMTDKCVFYRSKEIAIITELYLRTPRKTHKIFLQNSFGMVNLQFWIWAEILRLFLSYVPSTFVLSFFFFQNFWNNFYFCVL